MIKRKVIELVFSTPEAYYWMVQRHGDEIEITASDPTGDEIAALYLDAPQVEDLRDFLNDYLEEKE